MKKLWLGLALTLFTQEPYQLRDAALLTKTLHYIQKYYFEPARIEPQTMYEAALKAIQRTAPEVLAKCERPKFCSITVQQAVKRFPYPPADDPTLQGLKNSLSDVFAFLEANLDKDTKPEEIEYSAIAGLLTELDPHSDFLPPDFYREFRVGTKGEFGGLGIVIGLKDGRLTVTAPIEGTPAWKAGIKTGDNIIQIDDESTINMTLTEAVERLRGPIGTSVQVRVNREGTAKPLLFSLKRANINIQSVQSQLVKTASGKKMAFLRVKNFQSNTVREVTKQFGALRKKNNLDGIILDLRDNPGGLLDQAVALADFFLKDGVIVSTVAARNEVLEEDQAGNDNSEPELPLVVLMSRGSASASEIVAGALKNNNRAVVIGTQSFGKGSVQSIYEVPHDAAIKLTIAQYLTPGNQSIQSIGIIPDVEILPVVVAEDSLNLLENKLTLEKDLEKSLQVGNNMEKPFFQLPLVHEPPKSDEPPEYSNELKLEGDKTAEVAVALLDHVTELTRPKILAAAEPFLKERLQQEQEMIATRLQKWGVQWNLLAAKGQPKAKVTYQLKQKDKVIASIGAGESATLEIQLQNVGDGPFNQLVAQTDAKELLFQNIEFAFGTLPPSAAQKWKTTLKIPEGALSEEAVLELKFTEQSGKPPAPVEIILPIKGKPRPHFAHRFTLEPNWREQMKQGKTVTLNVEVQNQGEGTSKNAVVALRNRGGKELFIEKGRMVLTELKPKQTATVPLRFHIDPKTAEKNLKLEVSITDLELMVRSNQELTLAIGEGTINPPAAEWYSPPFILLNPLAATVAKTPLLLQGNVKDDESIRDLFIFVEDDKAFYETNVAQEKSLDFKTPLALKAGNNRVTITVRDNWNLSSQEGLVIRYDPPKRAL